MPGVEVACPRCGRKLFVPPILSKYSGCVAKDKEVEGLLDKIRWRGATLEEETLLEYYRQVGLLEC